MDKKWYTKREVMELMGVSRSTIQRLMREGMPFITYKGKVVFDISVVRPIIEQREYEPYDAETLEELKRDIK